jgi:hypothetical protein
MTVPRYEQIPHNWNRGVAENAENGKRRMALGMGLPSVYAGLPQADAAWRERGATADNSIVGRGSRFARSLEQGGVRRRLCCLVSVELGSACCCER